MSQWWDRLSFPRKLAIFLFFVMWVGFTIGLLVSFEISWATLVALAAIWLVYAGIIYVVGYGSY